MTTQSSSQLSEVKKVKNYLFEKITRLLPESEIKITQFRNGIFKSVIDGKSVDITPESNGGYVFQHNNEKKKIHGISVVFQDPESQEEIIENKVGNVSLEINFSKEEKKEKQVTVEDEESGILAEMSNNDDETLVKTINISIKKESETKQIISKINIQKTSEIMTKTAETAVTTTGPLSCFTAPKNSEIAIVNNISEIPKKDLDKSVIFRNTEDNNFHVITYKDSFAKINKGVRAMRINNLKNSVPKNWEIFNEEQLKSL